MRLGCRSVARVSGYGGQFDRLGDGESIPEESEDEDGDGGWDEC